MKTIMFTGDSHTCGQGADGWHAQLEGYNPLGTGLNDGNYSDCNSYVNLVRDYVLGATGTAYKRYTADKLAFPQGHPLRDGMVDISSKTLKLGTDGQAVFIMLAESTDEARVKITPNGQDDKAVYVVIHTKTPRHGRYSYRIVPIIADNIRSVELEAVSGEVLVKQIEVFKGQYACVNAAVGFCPVGRYMRDYYQSFAEAFIPDIIIAEAHTINDWIDTDSPDAYERDLTTYLSKCGERGARVVMTTVSPILGDQKWQDSKYVYGDYLESAKRAAQKSGVVLADSGAVMKRELEGLSEEEKSALMFSDNWHVNSLGHKIYADTIIEKLKELL
ncbi:MAG: SGNH/GDSL hydrolase family protein [Eubacteriales bacterium]